jgi:diguanylate cyclase (GGDEF)-like protein
MVAQRGQLEWAATHDALTGLANRKALQLRLDGIVAAALLTDSAQPAALLMLDLDRFKPINDQHGHAAGDAALRAVAQAVAGCIRGCDLLARLGGDEFAVLLERCPVEVASRVAEDIRLAVADLRIPWKDATLSLGVSIGVAGLDAGPDGAFQDVAAWMAAADTACYEAKAHGRDAVRHAPLSALHPPLRLLRPSEGVAA